MAKSTVTFLEKMKFDVELNGHNFTIDASKEVGGEDAGPRPKGLLLSALGGCTGMDVVSILRKMKVEDFKFKMDIDADSTNEHPKHYNKIRITYIFEGENLPEAKIIKAVNLSETRYCGVSEMLRKAADIEVKIVINNKEIPYDL